MCPECISDWAHGLVVGLTAGPFHSMTIIAESYRFILADRLRYGASRRIRTDFTNLEGLDLSKEEQCNLESRMGVEPICSE